MYTPTLLFAVVAATLASVSARPTTQAPLTAVSAKWDGDVGADAGVIEKQKRDETLPDAWYGKYNPYAKYTTYDTYSDEAEREAAIKGEVE